MKFRYLFRPLAMLSLIMHCSAEDLSTMNIDAVYQQLCSSCHGKNFEGGLGGSLVDGEWKHGAADADIMKSIREGNAKLGMTPFGNVLSDKQIRAMVIFLREKEAQNKNKKLTLPKPEVGKITETKLEKYQIEIVAEGLSTPWAIAFLPDGSKLITEKTGKLRRIDKEGKLEAGAIEGIPHSLSIGQGGLLEVAIHPDYANNGWVYLGLSDPLNQDPKSNKALTAVYRGRIKDSKWVEQETIWKGPEANYTEAGHHFGTRFVFKDGYLYFPVGERGGWNDAQDPANAKGKTYRIHDDGRIPEDNPKFGDVKSVPGLWSIGHRNPQGYAIDPRNGDIYDTEHGPRGGDELNLIQPGKNYGWPVVTYGMNYDGSPITDVTKRDDVEEPIIYWVPSIAVCGLDFYTGDKFANWKNDLLVGALREQEIRRLRIEDRKVVDQEVILKGVGRVRDVATGPDGFIYVLLNQPDMVIRLIPAKQ